jgi:hypothetical protein
MVSRSWHNGGDIEIGLYARSLQNAAKTLVKKLELDQSARTDWDVCPVVLLYRQALEIRLKLLIGAGNDFLPSPTDAITLYKTHSSRWLAQIVCQTIKAVGWENQFKCEGVSSLSDFSALVAEVEAFDPVARAIRSSKSKGPNSVSEFSRAFNIFQFATRLEALLELLDAMADALAAEWNRREETMARVDDGADDFGPTIQ